MKYILTMLLVVPLFFIACKKNDRSEFVIEGIPDTVIGTSFGNELPLSISISSGLPETVSLSATGLPAGLSVAFDPASGVAPFSTTATFKCTVAGTYPIKIIGSSASYARSYDITVDVHAMNGWVFDGVPHSQKSVSVSAGSGVGDISISDQTEYESLSFRKDTPFPTANGTYTYPLGAPGSGANVVSIMYSRFSYPSFIYFNTPPYNTMFTLVIANGRIQGKLPATTLEDTAGRKTLVVDFAR